MMTLRQAEVKITRMKWLEEGLISDLSDSIVQALYVMLNSWDGDGYMGVRGNLLLSLFIHVMKGLTTSFL